MQTTSIPRIRLRGRNAGDRFGESVAILNDINGNGALDLFIGAPGVDADRGEAYVFYGPFEIPPGQTELLLEADDADVILTSYFSNTENFGRRVAPLYDLTGNGRSELRVQSLYTDIDDTEYVVTQVITNLLPGSPNFGVPDFGIFDRKDNPCSNNLWDELPGDVLGDLFVSEHDVDQLMMNMGLEGDNLTTFDGDLNGDGIVDAYDQVIVLDEFGKFGPLWCIGWDVISPLEPGSEYLMMLDYAMEELYAAPPNMLPIGPGHGLEPIPMDPLLDFCRCGGFGGGGDGGDGGDGGPGSGGDDGDDDEPADECSITMSTPFVRMNADNDNGSPWVAGTSNTIPTVRDFNVSPIPNENDLAPLHLSVNPADGHEEGYVVLHRTQTSQGGLIRIWDSMSKDNLVMNYWETEHVFSLDDLPDELFVEGVRNSREPEDIELKLEFVIQTDVGPFTQCTDEIKLTVTPVVTDFTAVTGDIIGHHNNDGVWVLEAVGPGIAFSASANVTNAGPGGLYFVQNIQVLTGTGTFTPQSGLVPVSASWSGEPFNDVNGNGQWDPAEPYEDLNGNGLYDPGEPFTDLNGNGQWDPAEPFWDVNFNGQYDAQFPLPLLDALENPPPQENIFYGEPATATIQNNVATLTTVDSPLLPFPNQNPDTIQSVDVLQKFGMWVVWQHSDGSIWPLASMKWTFQVQVTRAPAPEGGTALFTGPNHGITASPMTYNHTIPVVVPPIANSIQPAWK